MQFAGPDYPGRIATGLASWFTPRPERHLLAQFSPRGYIAPDATIYHSDLHLAEHVFIGERVHIQQFEGGGPVELGAKVLLSGDTRIETAFGGMLTIGTNTFINQRCWLAAIKVPIHIGRDVIIAPNCALYSANHGVAPGELIRDQSYQTKGEIVIEDGAWLGWGVTVLDGVRIGKGAVVGAGAVVTHDIPQGAIAVGVPARVVKLRSEFAEVMPASILEGS